MEWGKALQGSEQKHARSESELVWTSLYSKRQNYRLAKLNAGWQNYVETALHQNFSRCETIFCQSWDILVCWAPFSQLFKSIIVAYCCVKQSIRIGSVWTCLNTSPRILLALGHCNVNGWGRSGVMRKGGKLPRNLSPSRWLFRESPIVLQGFGRFEHLGCKYVTVCRKCFCEARSGRSFIHAMSYNFYCI